MRGWWLPGLLALGLLLVACGRVGGAPASRPPAPPTAILPTVIPSHAPTAPAPVARPPLVAPLIGALAIGFPAREGLAASPSPSPVPTPVPPAPEGGPSPGEPAPAPSAPSVPPDVGEVPEVPPAPAPDGCGAFAGPAPAPVAAPPLAGDLAREVAALVAGYEEAGLGIGGVMVTADCGVPVAAYRADDPLPTASLYKLFVLWAVQHEIAAGHLSDDAPLVFTPENDNAEDDGYQLGEYGDTIPVAEARALMITASNNTAAWMLAQQVGWGAIDELLIAGGFAQSRAAEGVTTPREMARFLDALLTGALDPELRAADYALMHELLAAQQINTLLSTGFPEGTPFAHKTGNLPGVTNDAGIVTLPDGRTLTIAALLTGDEGAAWALMHDLAALIWAHAAGP